MYLQSPIKTNLLYNIVLLLEIYFFTTIKVVFQWIFLQHLLKQ